MKNGSFTIMLNEKDLGESGMNHLLVTPKAGLYPKKVMLCVWWDWKGILYYELLPNNETTNSEKYCSQLNELKTTIEQKRPEIANQKGVFHQDNMRPHVSLTKDKSCWSSIGMFYSIHQISRPLISTYFDHYKIPLMEKVSTLWSR